jgi:uncharacterized protein (DUF924 family)
MRHNSEDVLSFWIEQAGPEKWYKRDDEFDEEIRQNFGALWEEGLAGRLADWAGHPRKALALVILLDQFPRNMFRDDPRAFATDRAAKTAACYALAHGWDMCTSEPEREFFYMPFMHSEILSDQDHAVRLMCERMPIGREDKILHARAHREVIRRFGRFPFRNEALCRKTTVLEAEFLAQGSYGAVVEKLKAAA